MFLLQKLISRLLFPVPLALIAGIVGLVLLVRSSRRGGARRHGAVEQSTGSVNAPAGKTSSRTRRAGIILTAASLAFLWLAATAPLSNALLWSLEGRYAPVGELSQHPDIDLIVVLGGGHAERDGFGPWASLGRSSRARVIEGVRLARQSDRLAPSNQRDLATGNDLSTDPDPATGSDFATEPDSSTDPGLPLVFTGYAGSGDISSAEMGRRAALELGIDQARTRIYPDPRNTREEAATIARHHGDAHVLLVTSASHMPRSVYLFEQAGLTVTPAPTDFRAADRYYSPWSLLPGADALSNTERAWYEYMGLAWARITSG